jgi:hypothetical protein
VPIGDSEEKKRNDIIVEAVDVVDDYHLARSFRRGVMMGAQLAGVPENIVNWVNYWGTERGILVKGPIPLRLIYLSGILRKLPVVKYL